MFSLWNECPFCSYLFNSGPLVTSAPNTHNTGLICYMSSSAFIHPLLDVGLSSDLPSLPILSRTDPIFSDNGCYVVDPSLQWSSLASPWCSGTPYWRPVEPSVRTWSSYGNKRHPGPFDVRTISSKAITTKILRYWKLCSCWCWSKRQLLCSFLYHNICKNSKSMTKALKKILNPQKLLLAQF